MLDSQDAPIPERPRRAVLERLLPAVVGLAGLWIAHHPMILSGFGRIQGDTGDPRFINYLLEHSYRWLRADPGHRAFWDPPFYYPAGNVAAHSDVLAGAGFPYWACRALGMPPDTSFQTWMIAVSALNYLCGYLLFRGGLRFGRPAAAAGAFLVAFGAPRFNHYVHQQLLPCFEVLLAIYALARLFSPDAPAGRARRLSLWLLSAVATAGQFYAGVYQGWFLIWTMVLATAGGLALPSCRQRLIRVLIRDAPAILVASAAGALMLMPLVAHYQRALRDLHQGYYPIMPGLWSWLKPSRFLWIWGGMSDITPFRQLPAGLENELGIGLLTPAACAAGLYLGRGRPLCRLSILVLLGWFACVSRFPVSGDTLSASAAAIAACGMAMISRDRDATGPRALAACGLVGFFGLVRHPNPSVVALGLFSVGLAAFEVVRLRDEGPGRLIWPWLVLLALCGALFHPMMLLVALGMVAPFWGLAEYVCGPRRREVRAAAAVAPAAILALLFHSERPWTLAAGLCGPPLAIAAGALPRRLRPPPRTLAWIILAALPAVVYCFDAYSLWDSIARDVPGARAIRGVGRAILIMLVPLGVGLAALLSDLEARRRRALAWSIGAFCLLEQGMTTPTYDKQAQRDRVSAIAARVDPRCGAFYYHTRHDGSWRAYVDYQIDAMWASLERGVPTINGYSSVWPRDWIEMRLAAFLPDPDVRDALHDWARARKLDLRRVEWIDRDAGPMRFSPFFGSMPGDPPVPGKALEKELDDPFTRKRPAPAPSPVIE